MFLKIHIFGEICLTTHGLQQIGLNILHRPPHCASHDLLFHTHLPIRFADGCLILVSISVHISARCRAFAIEPNINHSEDVLEIVWVCSLLFHAIQLLQNQFLCLITIVIRRRGWNTIEVQRTRAHHHMLST